MLFSAQAEHQPEPSPRGREHTIESLEDHLMSWQLAEQEILAPSKVEIARWNSQTCQAEAWICEINDLAVECRSPEVSSSRLRI
jgi:hypothetical protein